jgi:translocation and assembly module TamB
MDVAEDMPAPPPPRRRLRWRVLRGIGLVLAALVGLLLVGLWGIDTGPGHRLIADRISALTPSSGLRIRIGRIDGSIWSRATLRDVRLYDLKGRFFEAPEIRLDWHPTRWARNLLDIDRLATPLVILDRLPALKPKPGAPLLPGFDIHLGQLKIDRLRLGAAIAGKPYTATIAAKADIHGKRAMIGLNARTNAGDKVVLDLDAEPDGDRFKLAAQVEGPAGGTIAGLIGTKQPVTLTVGGRGTWHVWNGTAKGMLGGKPVADLALGVRDGRYLLSGMMAPSPFLKGKLQRLTEPSIAISGQASFVDRRLSGRLGLSSPALRFTADGAIDLAQSAFSALKLDVQLLHPAALFPNMTGRDVRLHAQLDGQFETAAFSYALSSPHIAFDQTGFDNVRATGAGHLSKAPIALPIKLHAARVTGVGAVAGGILANLNVAGTLKIDAKTLVGNDLALSSDKVRGKLLLRIDLVSGRYDVALTGGLTRYLIPGLGIVDVNTKVTVLPGPKGVGTVITGTGQAIVRRFDNAFLKSLAGGNPSINTRLTRTTDGVIHFSNLVLTGPAIRITGSGMRRRDGSFQFAGSGTQGVYGPFRMTLDGMIDRPTIRVVLEHPVEALGLTEVGLDLDPVADGFAFRARGGSVVGRFDARGNIRSVPNMPTGIEIADLAASGTHAKGTLRSDPGGFTGRLDLAGGGITGSVAFAPQGMLQRIEPHLVFASATLAASTPIFVRRGRADGAILLDPDGIAIDGTASGTGISRGTISLARASAEAHMKGGRGTVSTKVAGSGGRTFDITAAADIAPGRVSVTGQGTVEGRPIRLTAPAVLTMGDDLWQLAPVRLDYAGGNATVSGSFARASTSFDAGLDHMPLSVLDIFKPGLGLGGYASGKLNFRHVVGSAPTGRIDVAVRGMTRAGLVLSSAPVDLGLAASLTANGAAARAVVVSGGKTIGRAQAKIGPLPPGEDIMRRLIDAPLFAQLRYSGPGDTLWRLIGVETIDLSGPLAVSADIGGTSADPLIRGSIASDGGRLESATTGTVITGIKASGTFDGSRLNLTSMTGRAGNGTVSGRGSFNFGAGKGIGIDLQLQAQNAVLINRDDIGATVTGPLTMKSDGVGGTIGGDIRIERGRFKLGSAAAAQVPQLKVKEINRPDEFDQDILAPTVPWTLDIKARASSQLMVTGLGLDSEWRADLAIKGAINNPAIGGRVDLVRGGYTFAGRRFDLDRGIIRFTGEAPPDPQLDITALANLQGISATIRVTGSGLHPEISFASVPALPEDEVLSRLLFGTSITNLSAPEALQLAAAVASLRGGSGGGMNLDPINAVRKAVRLDRLRILPADVTTGQKTAVAAGKNIGRRTYVELITDGQGYSATSIEYRITRWLSVLGSVSTIGRQSVNLKVSKDY